MKKAITTLLLVILPMLSVLNAQNYDITGIKRAKLRDISAILENNEVKGYYAFYPIDKVSKKEYLYNLAILDNSLKQTYSVELNKSKRQVLMESSYNGDRFCFSFLDMKNKSLEYMLLDKTGKAVGSYSLEISRQETQYYAGFLQSDEDVFSGALAAVKGKGFVRFGMERESGVRMEMEFIDNAGKKVWTANSGATTKKSFETLTPFFTDEHVIIASLATRAKMLTKKGELNVIFYSTATGKEIARHATKTDKYQMTPLGASYDPISKSYFVYGQFYGAEDDLARDDSKGMYLQEVSADGKLIRESFSTWVGEINTLLVSKSKGKIEDNMKIFIHKVVRTSDGELFAVGEQYRKAVSALGVASNLLLNNSNVSVMKIELHNMLTFEFDKNFRIKDVHVFEKEKANVLLNRGMGLVDANLLGYYINLYGWFDYAFTSISADHKTFNSAYVNYDKDKEEGSNYTIGNIAYNKEQKLVIDRIKLKSKPSAFFVMQAKPGYIAIFEYFKKQKKAIIRLEKLNL